MSKSVSLSQAQRNALRSISEGATDVAAKTAEALAAKGLIANAKGAWQLTREGIEELVRYGIISAERAAIINAYSDLVEETALEVVATSTLAADVQTPRSTGKRVVQHPANMALKRKPEQCVQTLQGFADEQWHDKDEAFYAPSLEILFKAGMVERDETGKLYRITQAGVCWLAQTE